MIKWIKSSGTLGSINIYEEKYQKYSFEMCIYIGIVFNILYYESFLLFLSD